MNKNWQGKAVSIQCVDSLGIFQGTIKDANPSKITIVRAFRNGLPLRTLDTEITIMASDIIKLELIPSLNNENTAAQQQQSSATLVNGKQSSNTNSNNGTYDKNSNPQIVNKTTHNSLSTNGTKPHMIPSKVEIRMSGPPVSSGNGSNVTPVKESYRNVSKPIDIIQKSSFQMAKSAPSSSILNTSFPTPQKISGGGGGGGNIDKRQQIQQQQRITQNRRTIAYTKNQAFGPSVDDPAMIEDFDFEKNLALFDKQAIWNEIDSTQKPDFGGTRATTIGKTKNYRHDENVLQSKSTGMRQITTADQLCSMEFVTDDGLIIPAIPMRMRNSVTSRAESAGLIWSRQCDILARGTAEMAIMLLGGARRLTPKNKHQWPTIVIIANDCNNERISEVGFATGRQLSSHGLKCCVLVNGTNNRQRQSSEFLLYSSSSNNVHTTSVTELPSCDLVILAVKSNLTSDIVNWMNDNRSPTLAIDPPVKGLRDVNIKYSILPVLPVDGISPACGKLYLCNLGIPDKFFEMSGIRYQSPFGHKFVIPIHEQIE